MRYLQCDKKGCPVITPVDKNGYWVIAREKDLCPKHWKEYKIFRDDLYKNAEVALEGWFNE